MMRALPRSRRTLSIAAVLLLLALMLGYVALRAGPMAPVAVTTAKVEQRALRPAVFGIGNVEARQVHRIGSTAAGRLLRINVEVGDKVKVGQILGEMDPVDSDDRLRSQDALIRRTGATLAEATARLEYAQVQARRYEQLYAERATSEELMVARRQDMQLATAALAAAREDQLRARADLQALRTQRSNLRLISPIDGVVTAREAEPATTVVAGQAVVEVVDPRSLWVNARFDQVSAGGLAAGQTARVVLRSRHGQVLEGEVRRTELRADAVTEELLAKVAFKAVPQPLPPIGERAEVTVDFPPLTEGPVIPNAAVHRLNGLTGVWMIQDDELVFASVKLGRTDLEGRVQVLEGLKTGDAIVLHSERALKARTRIKVVERIAGVTA